MVEQVLRVPVTRRPDAGESPLDVSNVVGDHCTHEIECSRIGIRQLSRFGLHPLQHALGPFFGPVGRGNAVELFGLKKDR